METSGFINLNSTDFGYNKASRIFSAEASTVLGKRPIPSFIYLKSDATGKTIVFKLGVPNKDGDGDIVNWNYTSSEKVNGQDLYIVLYND